jgi:hypothetical protein
MDRVINGLEHMVEVEGLQSLMDVNWTVYNTSNSGLPDNMFLQ